MIDYGEVVGEGVRSGLGMLWGALTASPGVAVLFVGVVVGALWLQLTPTRRRRR
ncbi:hypothetical protein [Microbacterium sp. 2FI]|uniref:hypothetical protein n=1 Tax=Microbacterium sp. 2FI TaxID=2502193 RepID=UPI0014853E47|nr:hypothetical protein [Microbacterium sp. 2FI]